MASPPEPGLASSAHLTPAAAKAKTNIPGGKQLTRLSAQVLGAALEAGEWGNQAGSIHLLYPLGTHSLRMPAGEGPCLLSSPSHPQPLARIQEDSKAKRLTWRLTGSVFWGHAVLKAPW